VRNARIKDVAEHAGVSVATITRVVNNSGYVSEKTRQQVLRSIETLGYIPNRMASALKNNSTRIIGHVIPYVDINPFFVSVGASVSRHAQLHDYHILTVATGNDREVENSLIKDLMSRMVECIIFTGNATFNPKNIEAVMDKNIPVIMIERPLDILGVDKLLINDIEGSSIATKQLLFHGHTNIGFIGMHCRESVEINRYEGFRRTLEQHGISVDGKNIVFVEDYQTHMGYEAAKQLFSNPGRKNMPTAIFFASDILACGGLQYMYNVGIRIPDDISVVGYDNTLSSVSCPPISSVAFPIDEIGKTVIDMFIERRDGERNFSKSVELSPFFENRNSIAELKKK